MPFVTWYLWSESSMTMPCAPSHNSSTRCTTLLSRQSPVTQVMRGCSTWVGVSSTSTPCSAVPYRPVVGDVIVERINADAPRRVVGVRGAVGHDRAGCAHPLEAVPDVGGDHNKRVVVRTEEDLHQVAAGRRAVPFVVDRQLNTSEDARIVQRHLPVPVPPLYDAGINGREVDLAKRLEVWIRPLEHLVDGAPFVGDPTEGNDLDPLDGSLGRAGDGHITPPAGSARGE